MSPPSRPGPGLYAHLPYCPSRCPYCDFFAATWPGPSGRDLARAVARQAAGLRLPGGRVLDSLFLGGGTPSMWPVADIAAIIQAARSGPGLAPGCEITLEANPGTLGPAKLAALARAGVNRLSLGAQSLDDRLLAALGRRHDGDQVRRAVRAARAAGFGNLNLDLMYGLPGQDVARALADLDAALQLAPDHLSLYELTLAPETPFGRRYAKGRPPLPGEEELVDMERALLDALEGSPLARYEVSNFARPGHACRHNQNTWSGGDYLAAGPGAHGHLDGVRWAFAPDPAAFMAGLRKGRPPLEFREVLTPEERALELIMLGLRTLAGVDLTNLGRILGKPPLAVYNEPVEQLAAKGWAAMENGFLRPTTAGLAMADSAAALFL